MNQPLSPADPRLTAYALGELPAAERAEIEAALKNSPECQREVEAIRQNAQMMSGALATEPALDLTPAQKRALAQSSAVAPAWLLWLRSLRWPDLAFGGAMAALLVAIVVVWPKSPPSQPGGSVAAGTNQTGAKTTNVEPVLAMAPLDLKLPAPTLKGTPEDLPSDPRLEPLTDKPRPPFLAPKGVKNVALGKPVTSNAQVITGELKQVTDGDKEAFDDQVVEMRKGPQYVQVDLLERFKIYAILIWHDHRYIQVYNQVIIVAADDAEFTKNVRVLYSNDYENKAGFGAGKDNQYFETKEGRLVDARGVEARYLRWYTSGSNLSALNNRTEMEVYALPGK